MSVTGAGQVVQGWQWGPEYRSNSSNGKSAIYTPLGGGGEWGIPYDSDSDVFHPTQRNLNVGLLLMKLHIKTNETMVNTQYVIINSGSLKISNANAEIVKKMAEQADNVAKAEKGGLVGEVFGYVATAITVIAAVVTLNPVLMMAAVVSISMIIATETGALEALIEEIGMDAFIAIMVVLAIVMMFAPVGAASAAGTAATTAAKTTQQLVAGAEIAASTAQIGAGVSQAVSANFIFDASMINGLVTRILAGIEVDRGKLDDLLELFQFSMERYYLILGQGREMIETSALTQRNIASV